MTDRWMTETLAEWRDRCDAQAARQEAAPNFVYRAFDSYGLLLYVGCSLNVPQRLATHRREGYWFQYGETIALSQPMRRSEAMRLEREAIEVEHPHFNSSMANHRLIQLRDPRATQHADRLRLYLAARADAELARQETAA